jgi:hypothetical protein
MRKVRVWQQIILASCVVAIGSCGEGRVMAEQSYRFSISPNEASEFKKDLKKFALENGYAFVDGSSKTKESRDYINQSSEKTSGKNPGLVSKGVEIIDVTVEPKDARSAFLIFAKTSAYDAQAVTLTVAYNENTASERQMTDHFKQSQFLRKWRAD